MATVASRLLRAARKASLASRTAAAAASRAAAMASRSARAAAADAARLGSGAGAPVKNCPTRGVSFTKPVFSSADYEHLPDDAKTPTDKDLESDEAVWALYERWCKAFNKERDHAEMARRFKLFRDCAHRVHLWNTHLPADPKEAAIYIKKRRRAKLLISKGQDVSNFEDWHLPMQLGPFADGEEPFLSEYSKRLLKSLEENDPFSAVQHVAAE